MRRDSPRVSCLSSLTSVRIPRTRSCTGGRIKGAPAQCFHFCAAFVVKSEKLCHILTVSFILI